MRKMRDKRARAEDAIRRIEAAKLDAPLRRPEVTFDDIVSREPSLADILPDAREQAVIQIKYEGYLRKQEAAVARFHKMEARLLPEDADYLSIEGMRVEARQKLDAIRPRSIGQAGRISGVSPADVAVLMIWLERKGKEGSRNDARAMDAPGD